MRAGRGEWVAAPPLPDCGREGGKRTSISVAAADSGGHAGGGEEGFMAGDREMTRGEHRRCRACGPLSPTLKGHNCHSAPSWARLPPSGIILKSSPQWPKSPRHSSLRRGPSMIPISDRSGFASLFSLQSIRL